MNLEVFVGDTKGEVQKSGMENRDQRSWGARHSIRGLGRGMEVVPGRKEGGEKGCPE